MNETTNSLGAKVGFHYFSWDFIIHFIWCEYDASFALDAFKEGQFETKQRSLNCWHFYRGIGLQFYGFYAILGRCQVVLGNVKSYTDVISSSNWFSVTAIFHVFKMNSKLIVIKREIFYLGIPTTYLGLYNSKICSAFRKNVRVKNVKYNYPQVQVHFCGYRFNGGATHQQ